MALNFQIQQFPFSYGLQEGVDPRQVPAGTLMTAENVAWQKHGRISKRLGTLGIAADMLGGGSIAAAKRLFTRGDELCLVDGTNLHSYSPGTAVWRTVAKVPSAGVQTDPLLDPTAGVAAADVATDASGIYLVTAWVAGDPTKTAYGALSVQVQDAASGAVLKAPTVLNTAACSGVRVMVIGTTAVVITLDGATIKGYTVNLSTMVASTATSLGTVTIKYNYYAWDACVIGSTVVIAYSIAASITLASFTSALVSSATGSIVEANGCDRVSIAGASGEVLYVLYSQAVASPRPVRIATANPSTLVAVTAAVTIETPPTGFNSFRLGVCRFDASNCIASYDLYDGSQRATTYKVSSVCVVDTSSRRGTWFASTCSRPFVLGGIAYQVMSDFGYSAGATFTGVNSYLAEIETSAEYVSTTALFTPQRLVGVIDLLVGGVFHGGAPPSSVAAISSTRVIVASPFQSAAPAKTFAWRQGVRAVSVTSGASLPDDMWRSVDASNGETYIIGAGLNAYDGRDLFTYGFVRAPGINPSTNTAGGSIAAGTYLYGGAQEFRSSANVLHRSPVSTAASQITTGATSTNTIQIFAYGPDTKQNVASGFGTSAPVATLVPVYRSTVDGTAYQRLTFEPSAQVAYSDQTAQYVTLTDTKADADIYLSTALSSRPAIYTTGGILDDYSSPSGVSMFYHADRLWTLGSDEHTWWYSKAFQDDFGVAPGFSPSFRVIFDEKQTAGAGLDDKAVFFSETSISYMLGNGPAPNGGSSDFTLPMQIQTDVGCTNARSVVGMPDGIMFQSARGIYLLTRGLELVWIGRPIVDTLASYPDVTSAVLVAKHNQVRFTCNNAAASAGVVLCFDYVEKQWSVSKYTSSAVANGCPIADACIWGGEWTFATPTGEVLQEAASTSANAYLDDSASWVPMKLETAWISATGPLAFQSVRTMSLHGESHTDHDLTVSVGFDSDTSYPQTLTHLAETPVTTVGVEECDIIIGTRRKCSTIRFKITDAEPTTGTLGTGQGPSFDMMGIEVGMKAGFAGTPATKRG